MPKIFEEIVTVILLVIMAIALAECIKTRIDINNYINQTEEEEECLEDISLV